MSTDVQTDINFERAAGCWLLLAAAGWLLLLPPPLLLLLMSVWCPCRWKTGAHELSNKNGQAASWCDRCDMTGHFGN
jgi:hypothetical protein